MMTEVMNRLEETAPEGRRKLGVLSLDNSPAHGWWTTITMRDWLDRCRDIAGAHLGKVDVVSLSTATDIQAALAAKDFILILNPYGEWLPLLTNNGNDDDLKTTIAAIKAFATAGGHWIETGGYPFYYAMRPQHFVNYSVSYPPAFADFFHIDGNGGALSIYGVRPAPSVPWNKDAIFVPGQLGLGGDVISGFCDRSFGAWVVANQSWTTPITRFAFGREAPADLAAYAKENGLTRRLTDKLPVTALDKFKNAVLVKYDGSAKEKSAKLDRLPPASLLYFDDYCKGGLNKEFPDVLPPAAGFGTSADLRAFLDRCRQAGHLTMPHTDPTWWSDKPRGATFAKAGDAPLMRGLDGKTIAEPIGTAEGWLVSPWHAAVQVANRFTVKQFSEEFPVDFLFRGGNGARVWRHDLNPAVPSPISGPDGLLAQLSEDSKVRPLATEAGWDRASDSAVMLSGMTLGLTADDDVSARPLLGEFYPPATWKLFPMAQYLSHDRVAMTLHSQNQDVNNPRTLAWALGMGFGLNFHTATSALAGDGRHDWLLWLDRLQKSVGSRYVGEPVNDFQLLRARRTDDGVIRAVYGQVNIVANLNDEPLPEAGRDLAAYGFRATAPGLLAATQKLVGGQDFGADGVSFVAENRDGKFDLWVYAPPERDVAVELPGTPPNVQLTFDGGVKIPVTAQNGAIRFRLPSRPGQQARVLPPAELIGKSPQDWPGAKPAIGVLGLAGLEASGSKILPEAWYSAFTESRLAKKFGLAVKPISTVAELNAALTAGPTAWLAIINPYGEKLPCSGPGNGKEMLAAVRRYVQNGGVWWETGGESFSAATFLGGTAEKPAWQTEPLAGAAILGLPIGTGDDSKNTPDLRLTPTGREWLGSALATRIEGRESSTCRSLPRTGEDPGHVTVLTGAGRDFMGGYRLRGWGWLWRIGGLRPNSAVVLPAAVAATEYVFTHPPIPAQDGIRYLWHATM